MKHLIFLLCIFFSFLSQQRCDLLLEQCKGNDPSPIIDDDDGLPKTVSVEESFIRGSVRNMGIVTSNLRILVKRLLRLLDERINMSNIENNNNNNNNNSSCERINWAYPNTLRVSIRLVDESLIGVSKRRPFVTKSKQANFDGSSYNQILSIDEKAHSLFSKFETMIKDLLFVHKNDLNVTKLNIAAVNFQDVLEKEKRKNNMSTITNDRYTKESQSNNGTKRQKTVPSFFAQFCTGEQKQLSSVSTSKLFGASQSNIRSYTIPESISSKKYDKISLSSHLSMPNEDSTNITQNNTDSFNKASSSPDTNSSNTYNDETTRNKISISGIDPNVLNELPPDIISEILNNGVVPLSTPPKKKIVKKKGIERFFTSKDNNIAKERDDYK